MNNYIFLTNEGHTFQPEDELVDIENLQVIGFAQGIDADDAYKNLRSENTHLTETSFEGIFCYQLAENYELTRKDFALP